MGLDSKFQIDHINNDSLDNRRINLRYATHAQNQRNRKGAKLSNTTGVRGVHFDRNKNRYIVQVGLNGKRHYRGSFISLEEAETCAIESRKEFYGE